MMVFALRTAIILGITTVWLPQTAGENNKQQTTTLEFPADRSMGTLYTRPQTDTGAADFRWPGSSKWQKLGFAKGRVEIPANCFVRLNVGDGACDDLSPLARLQPDSIDYLEFGTDADLTNQFKYVGKMTGLRGLRFRSSRLVDAGISELANLTKLEFLVCSAEKGTGFTDNSLEVIGRFRNLRTLDLRGNRITDEGLPALAACNSLETLTLAGTQVTGTGLDVLMMLPNLKSLSLGVSEEGAPVDDEGLRAIGQLKYLTGLRLSGTKITDAGLEHLSALDDLEHLSMDYTDVTDEGLVHLESLSSLKSFRFYKKSGELGDQAAEHLSKLKNLEKITARWDLTSDGIRELANLKKLKSVGFSDSVHDRDLDWIAKMSSLEELRLSDCGVTNRGIEKLTALTNLKMLTLRDSKATPACIKAIGKFPKLTHLRLGFQGDDHVGLQWPDKESWNEIANLEQLRSLSIDGLLLSDDQWPAISKLANLQRLEIDSQLVLTSSFFDAVQKLTQLNSLEIEEVIANHADLEKLASLKYLEYLNLRGSIDDQGLTILARLPSIRTLHIASDKITDEGIGRFKSNSTSIQKVSHYRIPVGHASSLNKDQIVQTYNGALREPLDEMIGKPAPKLSVEHLVNAPVGGAIDLTGYRGEVVLVDFWRSHVGHSRDENVHVKKVYEKYKGRGLKVVGIHMTRDGHRMPAFMTRHQIPWPCGVDKVNETADAWHTNGRYGIYLLDRAGNVRMSNIYPGDLERAVEIVLGESK